MRKCRGSAEKGNKTKQITLIFSDAKFGSVRPRVHPNERSNTLKPTKARPHWEKEREGESGREWEVEGKGDRRRGR